MKRVNCVQSSWIFTFTIFGHLTEGYPYSRKWLPCDHHAVVLSPEFCISRIKIRRQNVKKWKEKVQKNAQFSFCGWWEAFHEGVVPRGIQRSFLHGGAHCLFWNTTKAAEFLLNFQTHFALYGQENYIFEKEFIYLLMVHRRFIHFFVWTKEKVKMRPDLRWILCWIMPCTHAQSILLALTDLRSRYCTRIVLKD